MPLPLSKESEHLPVNGKRSNLNISTGIPIWFGKEVFKNKEDWKYPSKLYVKRSFLNLVPVNISWPWLWSLKLGAN